MDTHKVFIIVALDAGLIALILMLVLWRLRCLVFRKPVGGDVSLPLSEMAYISRKRWHRGSYHGGRDFLIVEMNDGSEVAFGVRDPDLLTRKMLEWQEPEE